MSTLASAFPEVIEPRNVNGSRILTSEFQSGLSCMHGYDLLRSTYVSYSFSFHRLEVMKGDTKYTKWSGLG